MDVELLKLEPAVIERGALTPGGFFDATTQWPGQLVTYDVELAQGDVVFFDVVSSEVTTDFLLLSPDGRTEVFNSYADY